MLKARRQSQVLELTTKPLTLAQFSDMNQLLDKIQRGVQAYLETKRVSIMTFLASLLLT